MDLPARPAAHRRITGHNHGHSHRRGSRGTAQRDRSRDPHGQTGRRAKNVVIGRTLGKPACGVGLWR